MRRFGAINLIAFYALILLADDKSVMGIHGLKNSSSALHTLVKELKNLRYGILPGTRWCGRGNIASSDSELGVYRELDKCCRMHDRCEDYIKPKSEKYGLYNKYICRSSLCDCELQFYECLKQSGLYAAIVGKLYFKKCKQCFRTYYSIDMCLIEDLDLIDAEDRNGRPVFCAKFERNPKWGH